MLVFLKILSLTLLLTAAAAFILTFRGKIKFFLGVITVAGAFLLSTVINIYLVNVSSGTNIINIIINENFDAMYALVESMPEESLPRLFGGIAGGNVGTVKNALLNLLLEIKEIYTIMFPAILILNTLLLSYVLFMITKQIIFLFKKDVSAFPKFSQLKLNRSAAFVFVLSYILPSFMSSPRVAAALSNINAILGGVAFICGLSFIDYKLRQKVKNAWLRLAVYIAVFFGAASILGLLVIILIFIAIFDTFADYRKLSKKPEA